MPVRQKDSPESGGAKHWLLGKAPDQQARDAAPDGDYARRESERIVGTRADLKADGRGVPIS